MTGFRRALRFATLLAALAGMLPEGVSAQQPAAVSGASGYHFKSRWKLAGDGGWNYLTLDAQTHRLYVARTNCVQIIDTERGALVREIPGLEGGHGVALATRAESRLCHQRRKRRCSRVRPHVAPALRSADCGRQETGYHRVRTADPAHLRLQRREQRYQRHRRGHGGRSSPRSRWAARRRSRCPMAGGTLFVNLEDKSELLAIDVQKNTVTHRWPLAPGAEPTGLALDPIKHRLFAVCRNGRMIVLDAQNGKHLAALPIGRGVDACAFDPGSGLAFASCGDGTLAVVQEDPAKPGEFRVLETVKTPNGARTMALDPVTHAVYLAAADFEAVPRRGGGAKKPQRPMMVPGSFVLLKFAR